MISDAHERRLADAAEGFAELAGGTAPRAIACDVTDEAQVQAMVDGTIDAHGRLDVLVNNAGLGGTAELVDMTDEQWDRVLDISLTGTMRCMRAALRHMYGAGGGVIVNNASVMGWRAQAGQSHYAAAKAGVMALDALRGDRGGAARRAHQRGGSVARHARVPVEGHHRRAARGAHRARGVRSRRRAVGGRDGDRVPRQRLLHLHDRRGRVGVLAARVISFATLDELRGAAGRHLGWTDWIEITQERVNLFADATGDHQWIHVDVDRANAESPFGGPIAHGFLTLSLSNLFLPQLIEVPGASAGVNYGTGKVRFPSPCRWARACAAARRSPRSRRSPAACRPPS